MQIGSGVVGPLSQVVHDWVSRGYRAAALGCREFAGPGKAADAGEAVYVPATPHIPASDRSFRLRPDVCRRTRRRRVAALRGR